MGLSWSRTRNVGQSPYLMCVFLRLCLREPVLSISAIVLCVCVRPQSPLQVNLVQSSKFGDAEAEYLFAPYSVFTVVLCVFVCVSKYVPVYVRV